MLCSAREGLNFSLKNTCTAVCCDPLQVTSNEYPQHVFMEKKNSFYLVKSKSGDFLTLLNFGLEISLFGFNSVCSI